MKIGEGQAYKILFLVVVFSSIYLNSSIGVTNYVPSDNFEYIDLPEDSKRISSSSLVKGGSNFTSATVLTIGSINGSFDINDSHYQYFKINLNASSTIIFTSITDPSIIMSIYDPSEQFVSSANSKDILHIQITVLNTGYHYIAFFRSNITYNTNFTLTISDPINGPIGSSSFSTAVLISPGTFSNNFTTSQSDQYFKIYLTNGTDIIIDIFGECNNVYLYNSSNFPLDRNPDNNPILKLSIIKSDYYYIRISHLTTISASLTITVVNNFSESFFYADGGDSFSSATFIPVGTTQNHISSLERNDYFKVSLHTNNIVNFSLSSLSPTSTSNTYLFFYIYQPNQNLLTYSQAYTPQSGVIPASIQLVITPSLNDTYYVLVSYDYSLEYKIIITPSFDVNDGGNNFDSATTITNGTFTGYLTHDETSDYFKILLIDGYDVIVTVTGECTSLSLYNSTKFLLEDYSSSNPSIRLSITNPDYYYIHLLHSTSSYGNYSLSVITQISGPILFADGGDSFYSARVITVGKVMNSFTSNESNEYFKVFLNSSQIVTFTLETISYASTYYSNMYFIIYSHNQSQLAIKTVMVIRYGYKTSQMTLTPKINDIYYIRLMYNYSLNYNISITFSADGTDGGDNFSSATLLTFGTYTGYLTNDERDEFYTIQLTQGYDYTIAYLCNSNNDIYLYNSNNNLLEKGSTANPSIIKRSIAISGYYYIQIPHLTTSSDSYSISIIYQKTGSYFIADGGDSFSNATLIPLGSILNRLDFGEINDYFKIQLNSSNLVVFNISSYSNADIYFYIYAQNYSLLTSGHLIDNQTHKFNQFIRLVITPKLSGSYFIRVYYLHSADYNINIAYSFYPSEPSDIHVVYDINRILSITWIDSMEHDLNYLIYRDTSPITAINDLSLNFKIFTNNAIQSELLGKVPSGVQKLQVAYHPPGTFYFAVIAINSEGLTSSITNGVSSTNVPINIDYPSQTTTSSLVTSTSQPNSPNNNISDILKVLVWIIAIAIGILGIFIYYNSYITKKQLIHEKNVETSLDRPNSSQSLFNHNNIVVEHNQEIEQLVNPKHSIDNKIKEGNFENYDQLLEAEKIGAKNLVELQLVKKFNASDYLTAKKIVDGNFDDMEQYTMALSLGAKTIEELTLVESTNAPNFTEANKISKLGFSDFQTYKEAISNGFLEFDTWELFQKRNQKLTDYIKSGLDVSREDFTKELEIGNSDELLILLDRLNIPLKGQQVLFSEFNSNLDTNTIIKDFTNENSNRLYKEFEFQGITSSRHQLVENCKICFKPLIGVISSCPKCLNDTHYTCLLNWVMVHKSCPMCRNSIESNSIIIVDKGSSNSCPLCKKTFIKNEIVIRCKKCLSTYHKSEFLEWIKVKGFCPNCNQKLKF